MFSDQKTDRSEGLADNGGKQAAANAAAVGKLLTLAFNVQNNFHMS